MVCHLHYEYVKVWMQLVEDHTSYAGTGCNLLAPWILNAPGHYQTGTDPPGQPAPFASDQVRIDVENYLGELIQHIWKRSAS